MRHSATASDLQSNSPSYQLAAAMAAQSYQQASTSSSSTRTSGLIYPGLISLQNSHSTGMPQQSITNSSSSSSSPYNVLGAGTHPQMQASEAHLWQTSQQMQQQHAHQDQLYALNSASRLSYMNGIGPTGGPISNYTIESIYPPGHAENQHHHHGRSDPSMAYAAPHLMGISSDALKETDSVMALAGTTNNSVGQHSGKSKHKQSAHSRNSIENAANNNNANNNAEEQHAPRDCWSPNSHPVPENMQLGNNGI
jgi:hypothetical protein